MYERIVIKIKEQFTIQASYFVPHKFSTKSGAVTRILRTSTGYYTTSEAIGKYERRRGKRRHAAQL